MMLSNRSLIAIHQVAFAQAAFHRSVAKEAEKIIRVQSVTQPNSRSTVDLHSYVLRERAQAAQWTRLAVTTGVRVAHKAVR